MNDSLKKELREEFSGFHAKLAEFGAKLKALEGQVNTLDEDFRQHEEVEKNLFDELLVAVLQNTENVTHVKDSVKGYVELQEDLTIVVRFIKKVTKAAAFIGKFTVIFGVTGAAIKYAYDWVMQGILPP